MRKSKPKKRQILPDPVYGDVRVTKFVNHLMYDGKKTVSYEIFYTALERVKAKMPNEEKSALEIWKAALEYNPASGSEVSPSRRSYISGSY